MKAVLGHVAAALTAAALVSARAADAPARLDAARSAISTAEVAVATALFRRTDWRGVADPLAELARFEACAAGEGRESLLREIRVKQALLTPGTNGCARLAAGGGSGIAPVTLGEVGIRVTMPRAVPLVVMRADALGSVRMPVVNADAVRVPVAGLGGGAFARLFNRWFERYARVRDVRFADGREAKADHGSYLWGLRERLSREEEGFRETADEYNARLGRAVWRRERLRSAVGR